MRTRVTSALCGAAAAFLLLALSAGAQAPANNASQTTGTTAAKSAATTGTTTAAPLSLVTDSVTITTETQPAVSHMLEATSGTVTQTLGDILGTTGTQTLSPEATPAPGAPVTTAAPPAPGAAPSAPVESEKPVYMQPREEMRIFDPGRGQGLSPLQQAVTHLREQEEARRKPTRARISDIANYKYVLEGENEAATIRVAELRALMSASARLYFGDKIIIGRELLEPYLSRYGEKAIAQVVIDGQPQILAGNKIRMPIRITVNLPLLYEDLAEKQFIAEPSIRPRVTIHLREMVGDMLTSEPLAMPRLAAAMENNLFRVLSKDMEKPALNIDLSKDAGQLDTARLEAERNGIDVILTGTMNTRPITTGQILYDTYHFWQTSLDLYLYRVDTGELIAHVKDSYSANAPNDAQAISKTLDTIVSRTGTRIATILHDVWPATMLNQMDYRVMVSGVNPATLDHVETLLQSFAPQMRIFRKAYYGDVAVLNLMLPEGKHIDLDYLLRHSTNPQFIVHKVDDKRFEIEPI
ncbi:hypothetical protein LLG95_12415 [bacterium]|nr:hypothetical protein [bacterium]